MATTTTYDPATSATQLATAYTSGRQAMLTAQANRTQATGTALTKLNSAMSTFESSLATLSAQKSMVSNSATFSSAVGTATAGPSAAAGVYSFYVETLATAGQVAYGGVTDTSAAGSGSLNVMLADGSNFNVNLTNADKDMDGTLTAQEIATAINVAADNGSRVTASTLTLNGEPTLVLSSVDTGADNAVSLDTGNVTNAALKAMLDDASKQTTLSAAQDAVVWFGPQGTGTRMQQASNTFDVVDDVKITFTQAQAPAAAPVTVTVGLDSSATQANVQSFVDSYNELSKVLADLTASGDPASGKAAGPFAHDSGLIALRNRLTGTLRQLSGDQSLPTFGITAQRDGSLALDGARLKKAIATHPDTLDKIFGSASANAPSGVLGGLDKLMNQWTSSVDGQITQRKSSVSKMQISLMDRQATLDEQYNSAYKRYLTQFSSLQSLQNQMTQNTGLFDAMFSSGEDS
ncbi:flagellar filament capping protein FliD [Pseudoduganella namucuonensis]|uniref:Flagellar hook-associated protein 2 n=1 Tax=Pseudoduganella namucuonensis TaxID=1035707 RepID=A0A1I7HTN4_9BURK|nr:flagellar filament capping protein FliD [Pseudoduganella namucuonensis]SFU64085.1 flagellar hook-associated protein 2 [Pseudoduganella namucuonensis]